MSYIYVAYDIIFVQHDIQLHLHPQWLGAEYSEKGWLLNESLHRLANVATEKRDNEINLIELLHNGKETLESLIQSVDKTYRCRVLRAGGLFQPGCHPSAAVECVLLPGTKRPPPARLAS